MNKIAVDMKGKLDPFILETPNFKEFIADMNVSAAHGKVFIVGDDAEGNGCAINLPNILAIRELDDEDAFLS